MTKEEDLEAFRKEAEAISFEIDGVLEDCKEGGPGFDEVCKDTLRKVRMRLISLSKGVVLN